MWRIACAFLDLFRDVLGGADEEGHRPVRPSNRRDRDPGPDDRSVGPDEALVHAIAWNLVRGEPARQLEAPHQILGEGDLLERSGEKIRARATQNFTQPIVGEEEAALVVELCEADRRQVDGRPQSQQAVACELALRPDANR
jgi:hypothetical protein